MKLTFFAKLKWKIIFWLSRRLPDCKTITPKIGKALDGKLTRREKFMMNLHLYTCQACARYAEQIEFIREVFREHEKYFQSSAFPVKLRFDARERIKSALQASIKNAF